MPVQNVADHLSSRAYMELASRFPARRRRQLAAAARAAHAGGGSGGQAGGAGQQGGGGGDVDASWLNCEDSVDWDAVSGKPGTR